MVFLQTPTVFAETAELFQEGNDVRKESSSYKRKKPTPSRKYAEISQFRTCQSKRISTFADKKHFVQQTEILTIDQLKQ